MSATIFLSVVSSEFHHKDPQRPQSFESYRDILTRSLRRQIPGCQVIVQEELKQGYGDLLHTLDDEVRRSTVVIHLIGDTAGETPEPAELRRLRQRHPEFLAHQPELSRLLTDEAHISYTQWEAYLAFQHRCARLVFTAERSASRSPRFLPDEQQRASQKAHLQRIERTGEHRQPCHSQADIAVKSVVTIERRGLNPTQPTHTPAADNVSGANAARGEIIAGFVAALRQSVKAAITEYDPAGIESYLKSLDPIVSQYGLTRQFLLNLIAEETELRRRTAEAEPTAENLYDLAFAELALGNCHDAMVAVIQSIDEETRLMTADHARHDDHRDRVLSGHLLWRDAAEYAGLRAEVLRAMENGARFIDRDRDPLLWTDFHETIAKDCLKYAQYQRAETLIDDILDIREEHQPESVELAKSLLVWCNLLYHKANFDGLLDVARRAEGIFASQMPPDQGDIASCLNCQALSHEKSARYAEAEPLYRRALAIREASFGPDHPDVATGLNNLAALQNATNRPAEAEPLYRRALDIFTRSLGPDHPSTLATSGNYEGLLQVMKCGTLGSRPAATDGKPARRSGASDWKR